MQSRFRTFRLALASFATLATFAVALVPAGRAADGPAITDPKEAGIDYQIQGEYVGKVPADAGDETWGAQVIALGNGQFELIGYKGGLPGDGWKRGDETKRVQGELKQDETAEFYIDEGKLVVGGGKLSIVVDGTTVGKFAKAERKSPTLGKAAPEDAKVLFDGKSLDGWDNGKLVDDQWLGATNATTKQKLGDHSLHIEFRTPFMPTARGQARGNSGVYMQGRYELQVLDSFGLDGKNNECGGIYTIAEPIVNMCLPPLVWQTYDIDFTAAKYEGDKKVSNARVTIKHNGVTIHDNLELPSGTPGYQPEGPGKESLFLQDHGNPVVFRNIWVVEK